MDVPSAVEIDMIDARAANLLLDTRSHQPVRAAKPQDEALLADIRFMQAWEADRPMHPGMMLRIRQIRRASAGFAS
jgi:hypothetical protein